MAKFSLTPDKLVPAAKRLSADLRERGYRVIVEPEVDAYPTVPTMHAKRTGTTVVVVVVSRIFDRAIQDWVNYACSCASDVRVAIGLNAPEGLAAAKQTEMSDLGVGVYWIRDERVDELVAARDVGLNLELPSRNTLPPALRRILSDVYDEYERGDWEDCFEAAALALETTVRTYLKDGLRRGRITLIRGKRTGPWSPSATAINRMTLGDLRTNLGYIQNQNAVDAQIGRTIARINKDRIGVVHHRRKHSTRTRLRRNIGAHIWLVISTLAKMKGVVLSVDPHE